MPPRKRARPNSTAMRMVGEQVAVCRVAKGMTQKELGKRVGLQEESIASIEQGRRPLMPDVAELMDQILDLPGVLTVAAHKMPQIDVIPPWAEPLINLEQKAAALSSYQNQVVPGLLQTKAYAEAVFHSRVPIYTDGEVVDQTTARLDRQKTLRREKPMIASFIVWEPVLTCPLGGQEVLREQLRHLLVCSELTGVSIQILPLDRTRHPALDGPFVLLETPEHQHIAYLETHRGSLVVSDLDEVSILAMKYAMLRTQALNPEETRDLLKRLLGDP
ncbi:helix-turn-helix transcriptional regulator [Streptomyces sp. NBC_00091]|uniref:helix-turn-helix domain-containing protein n=1 Tax=Streptomyces sp. NBC_00091 TaxID=2975648 RepID=UPI002259CF1C|nr:helix-turn-helix transcriptional regulator [Streptomyces sp. NBC_00091]MCX5377731.1 helix-turn-helix transcriptional regulator [Streptomyces sp. NBC_00091]